MAAAGCRRFLIIYLLSLAARTSSAVGTSPLFVTFDSNIDPGTINNESSPFLSQIKFVWGSSGDARRERWRANSPSTQLSYYMPYSRAPSAALGFDLSFWQTQHPDWILYQCDRKTVAFWDGQTAPTGSVPLDFTNPDVIAWQVGNQSVLADSLGYDSMAFDNFGGGAREGANPGKACGVYDKSGVWQYRFGQNSAVYNDTKSAPLFREASVSWIEQVSSLMRNVTPGLGIVPNLCVDNAGWSDSSDAKRVAMSATGVLSERGFTGWGSGRIQEHELLDEYRWMAMLSKLGKSYYSINEVSKEEWSEDWIEWVMACFLIGQQPGAALWIGTVQGYGGYSIQPETAVNLGAPTGDRFRTGEWPILMQRNFTNGIVILNPSETSSSVFVGKGLVFLNGTAVPEGQMMLAPQTARVLVTVG